MCMEVSDIDFVSFRVKTGSKATKKAIQNSSVRSFIGSSMAFLIAFILPCWSFIIIEDDVPTIKDEGDRNEVWIKVARIILVFSTVGALTCTLNSLL